MKKNHISILSKTFKVFALLLLNSYVFAQPLNSVTADPSAVSIIQVPNQTTINSTAVMEFNFRNNAALVNLTGQIPIGAVRISITFPTTSAYTSFNSIPKFGIENLNTQPGGTLTLTNTSLILEQENITLSLNVRGTATGLGTISYNVSVVSAGCGNVNTSNDNFSASFNTITVLPVHLNSFNATTNNCVTKISWQSAVEDNFKSYSLEYSYDGKKYINFYEVNAKGNNSSYDTEHNATDGKVFYRLKMIDFDGKYEYSKILQLNVICNKNWALVYPNPTAQIINVNISTSNNLPTTVVLYDISGKRVLSQLLQNGTNKINVSKITPGIYTLTFSDNTGIKNSSIIIE